jgi:hypothetical protein
MAPWLRAAAWRAEIVDRGAPVAHTFARQIELYRYLGRFMGRIRRPLFRAAARHTPSSILISPIFRSASLRVFWRSGRTLSPSMPLARNSSRHAGKRCASRSSRESLSRHSPRSSRTTASAYFGAVQRLSLEGSSSFALPQLLSRFPTDHLLADHHHVRTRVQGNRVRWIPDWPAVAKDQDASRTMWRFVPQLPRMWLIRHSLHPANVGLGRSHRLLQTAGSHRRACSGARGRRAGPASL